MKRPLLLPLVPLYSAGLAFRELRLQRGWEKVRSLRYPVISIGNLSSGGSGKTPLTIALAKLLSARGFQVDVLSRGYGRRSATSVRVDLNGSADDFGDEPLLIAQEAGIPVFVAPDRYDAGKLAEADAAEDAPKIHLLDDGFQHRQLARDINILLLSREDWHDALLPAGNLREPQNAIRRADVIAVPANDAAFASELRAWGWTGPLWHLRRHMQVPEIDGPVVAFCGIARPGQFFAGLESRGVRIANRFVFPDHHRYTHADVARLDASAQHTGAAAILTTDKDRVRIGKILPRWPLHAVPLRTEIEDESAAVDWLLPRLSVQIAKARL